LVLDPTTNEGPVIPLGLTERRAHGEVLAMLTSPVLETLKSVVVAEAVEEPMAKSVLFVLPLNACTESFANGEVVPMPRFPEASMRKRSAYALDPVF
jgi:hypothetical protein